MVWWQFDEVVVKLKLFFAGLVCRLVWPQSIIHNTEKKQIKRAIQLLSLWKSGLQSLVLYTLCWKTSYEGEVLQYTVIYHVCIYTFWSWVEQLINGPSRLSRRTYKVLSISLQKMLIVGHRALVDEALPCASQVDTGILQDKSNPEEIYDVFIRHSQRNTQPRKVHHKMINCIFINFDKFFIWSMT